MALEPPPQGSVIYYPYLWAAQRDAGETEGRKSRPACLLLRVRDSKSGFHHLFLLGISSQPPQLDENALEIPDIERRRAGLTRYPRAWIVVNEYNYDIAERSYYYDPNESPLGKFSGAFLREIAKAARTSLARRSARVDRTL